MTSEKPGYNIKTNGGYVGWPGTKESPAMTLVVAKRLGWKYTAEDKKWRIWVPTLAPNAEYVKDSDGQIYNVRTGERENI